MGKKHETLELRDISILMSHHKTRKPQICTMKAGVYAEETGGCVYYHEFEKYTLQIKRKNIKLHTDKSKTAFLTQVKTYKQCEASSKCNRNI